MVLLTQSNSEVKKPEESTRLTCAVQGLDLNTYGIHWSRRPPGKGIEWLMYYFTSSSYDYAAAIQGRFSGAKDSSGYYLQMDRLKPEDTAVYYCACVAAQWWKRNLSPDKN